MLRSLAEEVAGCRASRQLSCAIATKPRLSEKISVTWRTSALGEEIAAALWRHIAQLINKWRK